MLRWLCRCTDRQGPPISAVGSPLPPPYARSPSLEFHTPPIEVHPIEDAESIPSSPAPVPVPPPAPESPILFSDVENIPPACGANPPAPRAPLQPIEEVVSDAENYDAVAERLEDQIGDETALSFLNGSNQGRGLVTEQCMVLLVMLLPTLTKCKQEIVPDQGPSSSSSSASNNEEIITMTSKEGVINVPAWNPTPTVRTVSFLTDHQRELSIRALQAAQLINQDPTFWSVQGSISADSFSHYRLELAIDLTEEEEDQMVHQLAGLGD